MHSVNVQERHEMGKKLGMSDEQPKQITTQPIMTRAEFESEKTKRIQAIATLLPQIGRKKKSEEVMRMLTDTFRECYYDAVPEANKWNS